MANHRQANVIFADTTATFDGVRQVMSIRYVGVAGDAATVTDATSGNVLWEASGAAQESDTVDISGAGNLRVEITNTAKVYLYLGRR